MWRGLRVLVAVVVSAALGYFVIIPSVPLSGHSLQSFSQTLNETVAAIEAGNDVRLAELSGSSSAIVAQMRAAGVLDPAVVRTSALAYISRQTSTFDVQSRDATVALKTLTFSVEPPPGVLALGGRWTLRDVTIVPTKS
jgi:hypothetical protein